MGRWPRGAAGDASRDRRWSAGEARGVLARARRSGVSLRAFAQREGLDVQRLYRWRRILDDGRRNEGAPATFAEVVLPRSFVAAYEVALKSGRVVRLGASFDEETLRRLLAVVDEGGEDRC